jgi:hypothetical protein
VDYAHQWVDWYDDPERGQAGHRLSADLRTNPALAKRYDEVIGDARTDAARAITRRAISRGEVGSGIHTSTIPDLLVGALNTHWTTTPPDRHDRLRRTFRAYADDVVDLILGGVMSVAAPAAATRPRSVGGSHGPGP